MKIRRLYKDGGDHIAFRDASEHVYDPRDLDKDGKPPGYFLQQVKTELEPGEVEFDHEPTQHELQQAFPDYYARHMRAANPDEVRQ